MNHSNVFQKIPTLNALRILETHLEEIRSQSLKGHENKKNNLFRNNTDSRANYRRLSESSDGETIIKKSKRSKLPHYILFKLNNVGKNIRYIERTLKRIRQIEDVSLYI